jgi:uncharacterized integral membrane protein
MSCQFNNSTQIPALYPNGTQYSSFNYSQFIPSIARAVSCGGATYLRPDVAGALVPWLYTIVIICIHLPVVLVRVQRWDKVQTISLALAVFQIAITLQGYKSTGLAPEEVLVWMPLTLPLDAGSMLQLAVLIVEDVGYRGLWNGLLQKTPMKKSQSDYELCENGKEHVTTQSSELDPNAPKTGDIDTSTKALIAIGATIAFFTIVSLQIVGVYKAAQGSRISKDLMVSWCSPLFTFFTVAASDANCNLYTTTASSAKGLGCINLPAAQQKDWLKATVALGSMSLIFEFCDFLILVLVHGKTRWRNIKMKRPWFTMFSGILILVILAIFGYQHTTELPHPITETVMVYFNDLAADAQTVCVGKIYPAGLRGAILGWTDGVFDSWGSVYYGSSVHSR